MVTRIDFVSTMQISNAAFLCVHSEYKAVSFKSPAPELSVRGKLFPLVISSKLFGVKRRLPGIKIGSAY